MRAYSQVYTCFWTDTLIQSLTDAAKLLALYLLTGPHTTMLGCFRLPVGYVAEDLKWEKEAALQGLVELENRGFMKRDALLDWVWIPQFLKWNPIENPNQAKGIAKLVDQLPPSLVFLNPLKTRLLDYSKHFEEGFRNRLETLSQPFRNQEQEQEQKKEQEQETSTQLTVVSCSAVIVPSVMTIPLKDQTEFIIHASQLDEWKKLYPQVDVMEQLRLIRGWNLANPKKRKTHQGILKHITQWLSKTQQQARRAVPSLVDHNQAVGFEWLHQTMPTYVEGGLS
jgi:hypothetical protein